MRLHPTNPVKCKWLKLADMATFGSHWNELMAHFQATYLRLALACSSR